MPGYPDYLILSHLLNEAILCTSWTRPLTQAEVERGAEVVRAAAVRYRACCWLVDARSYPLTAEQYSWSYHHFLPGLTSSFAAPMRIAVLMQPTQLAAMHTSQLFAAAPHHLAFNELPFRFHLFEDEEHAMEWLLRPSYV